MRRLVFIVASVAPLLATILLGLILRPWAVAARRSGGAWWLFFDGAFPRGTHVIGRLVLVGASDASIRAERVFVRDEIARAVPSSQNTFDVVAVFTLSIGAIVVDLGSAPFWVPVALWSLAPMVVAWGKISSLE